MSLIPSHIKAIIFDLDDTLYDCSGTLVLKSRKRAAKIISGAINCSEKEALELQLKLEEKLGPKTDIYREIANLYNLSDKFYKEVSKTVDALNIKDITLFPDVTASISKLKRDGYKLILVTAGDRDLQERKIKALGLERAFDEIIITNNSSGKEKCFREVLIKYDLKSEQVFCVGDKIKDEIEVGENMGMLTALMKHGRYYNFYKSKINDRAPYMYITKVSDLLGGYEN
ncbi:MAG: HAD-IA family hydrolase [Candidatus Scalindua sediminis]|nr:HAD-IA family hydrolase [Candidatus Scalindua sediminis]HDY66205.1 HAD family hydrolase [Candidatus Scalindua sp.]